MKSLLVLLALTLTTSAFARGDRDGRISVNSGDTIIRIEVGNERENDSRAMMRRMVQLERAVRELQNRVYDLEDDARPQTRDVTVYTCATLSNFRRAYIGAPALTELEAKSNAKNVCSQNEMAMFCENEAKCETRIETKRI